MSSVLISRTLLLLNILQKSRERVNMAARNMEREVKVENIMVKKVNTESKERRAKKANKTIGTTMSFLMDGLIPLIHEHLAVIDK